MKEIPKPQGNELRMKRIEKSEFATDWLPEDALYQAYLRMQEERPVHKAVLIAWYAKPENGQEGIDFCYSLYNEESNDGTALATEAFRRIALRMQS